MCVPYLLRPLREAKISQTRRNHVERRIILPSLNELRDQFLHLVKGSRPSVHKYQRDGALDFTHLMHKMDLEGLEPVNGNVDGELRQRLVECRLGFPPVVAAVPVGCQALHVGQRDAVVPIGAVELVREVGEGELLLEAVELGLGDGDVVGRYLGHGRSCRSTET